MRWVPANTVSRRRIQGPVSESRTTLSKNRGQCGVNHQRRWTNHSLPKEVGRITDYTDRKEQIEKTRITWKRQSPAGPGVALLDRVAEWKRHLLPREKRDDRKHTRLTLQTLLSSRPENRRHRTAPSRTGIDEDLISTPWHDSRCCSVILNPNPAVEDHVVRLTCSCCSNTDHDTFHPIGDRFPSLSMGRSPMPARPYLTAKAAPRAPHSKDRPRSATPGRAVTKITPKRNWGWHPFLTIHRLLPSVALIPFVKTHSPNRVHPSLPHFF